MTYLPDTDMGAVFGPRSQEGRMTDFTERFIRMFGLTERTDAYTDRPHADLWSGSGVSPNVAYADDGSNRVKAALPPDADWPEAWADWPYRIVWVIPSERAHVTFCEGDVSLLVARSDEDFIAIGVSADTFYGPRERSEA